MLCFRTSFVQILFSNDDDDYDDGDDDYDLLYFRFHIHVTTDVIKCRHTRTLSVMCWKWYTYK